MIYLKKKKFGVFIKNLPQALFFEIINNKYGVNSLRLIWSKSKDFRVNRKLYSI